MAARGRCGGVAGRTLSLNGGHPPHEEMKHNTDAGSSDGSGSVEKLGASEPLARGRAGVCIGIACVA
eukprot:353414-Chlamydomonas_euryale.AAC.16